jgi:dTDP-4-amino-4,6-dideoxygalactose transaminase
MRYKVGHIENNFEKSLWEIGEPDVYFDNVLIEKNKNNNYKTTYCLEVDSSYSNFATSNLIVHNCEADIEEWGFKFHMNDVNASIGIENLKEVDDIIIKHQENAKYYDNNLKDIDGLTLLERKEDRLSSFWIYSMLVDKRADFMEWMKECGIVVSQVHERNDRHSAMREYRSHLPTLDKTVRKIVSIPVGWWVTEEQREYIVDCIKKGW